MTEYTVEFFYAKIQEENKSMEGKNEKEILKIMLKKKDRLEVELKALNMAISTFQKEEVDDHKVGHLKKLQSIHARQNSDIDDFSAPNSPISTTSSENDTPKSKPIVINLPETPFRKPETPFRKPETPKSRNEIDMDIMNLFGDSSPSSLDNGIKRDQLNINTNEIKKKKKETRFIVGEVDMEEVEQLGESSLIIKNPEDEEEEEKKILTTEFPIEKKSNSFLEKKKPTEPNTNETTMLDVILGGGIGSGIVEPTKEKEKEELKAKVTDVDELFKPQNLNEILLEKDIEPVQSKKKKRHSFEMFDEILNSKYESPKKKSLSEELSNFF